MHQWLFTKYMANGKTKNLRESKSPGFAGSIAPARGNSWNRKWPGWIISSMMFLAFDKMRLLLQGWEGMQDDLSAVFMILSVAFLSAAKHPVFTPHRRTVQYNRSFGAMSWCKASLSGSEKNCSQC